MVHWLVREIYKIKHFWFTIIFLQCLKSHVSHAILCVTNLRNPQLKSYIYSTFVFGREQLLLSSIVQSCDDIRGLEL